ncbi:hypothetical protein [Haloferula sp. BvORR071]|uniref:hypothetical protein n=1 Tax=Haloferula sp. BvORR071 TaxID=1396141 RepID=UPI0005511C36|nr:hypothetical protein [Haloferula sp. BvORR071]
MKDFDYKKADSGKIEQIGSSFCLEHGDGENGVIPDAEYDLLFDHLAAVLGRHGSFTEGHGADADFSGYRYVDQIPWITIVPKARVAPFTALAAALEAIQTAHRPFSVSFDYYPESLLVLPPKQVFSTFSREALEAQV